MSGSSKWIGAGGEDEGTIQEIAGDEDVASSPLLKIASSQRGSPFNAALFSEDLARQQSYYLQVRVTALDGNLSVGVVARDEFLPGYRIKGMFYNGNLTNGSAALVTSFGDDHIKAGMTVGLLYEKEVFLGTTPSLQENVYVYVNDRCLGRAFQLVDATNPARYPCLHVNGTAAVEWKVAAAAVDWPTQRVRTSITSDDRYEREWKLRRACFGPELGELTLPEGDFVLSLRMQQDDNKTYSIVMKFANTIFGTLSLTGEKHESHDVISISRLNSTKMMPRPPLDQLEREINANLPSLSKMIVVADDDNRKSRLVMTGATIELEFEPYEKVFAPLTKYHDR